jgi:hypothetical protein
VRVRESARESESESERASERAREKESCTGRGTELMFRLKDISFSNDIYKGRTRVISGATSVYN